MKKFSLKWKLFLIGNYLQFIVTGIALCFSIIALFNGRSFAELSIFIIPLLIICVNGFLNIFALHRYFPDNPIPQTFERCMLASGGLNALVVIFLLVMVLSGFTTSISTFIVLFLLTTNIFTLLLQFQLFAFLSKKEQEKMSSLIDTIGETGDL